MEHDLKKRYKDVGYYSTTWARVAQDHFIAPRCHGHVNSSRWKVLHLLYLINYLISKMKVNLM